LLTPAQAARLTVVLVSTRNSLNIGAAARAMSNFGVLDLRVVNPYEPSFREARSAVGAGEVMQAAKLHDTIAEAVADCTLVIGTSAGSRSGGKRSEHEHAIHSIETAAPLLRTHLESSRAAILFGSEKFGLSNDDLSHCHWLTHIPTREEHLSMNLGQAVAVCLYEITRPAIAAASSSLINEAATVEDRERLTSLWMEALKDSGYTAKHQQPTLEAELRRMLMRMDMNRQDAHITLGMLRQILWKIRDGS
jgi:TrmH family RNA methyltransferase